MIFNMKRTFLLLFFLSAVLIAGAQIRKIPATVTDAFATLYPHASHVEWKDKLEYFQAKFQLNGCTITAAFSSKGEWEGSERELSFEQLPDEVQSGFLKSKYAERRKTDAYEVQQLGKPLQYRICVEKSSIQKKVLYFDVNGKLVKESMTL
jgi:hypothetical protein